MLPSNLKLALGLGALAIVAGGIWWFAGLNYDRGYAQAQADGASRVALQEAVIKEAARKAEALQDRDALALTLKEQELNDILAEIAEASADDPAADRCGLPVSGVLRLQNIR